MKAEESRPVLILGMHRSGTSYLASRLAAFGVQLGKALVGPQKGNERGHFEDVEILEFHEGMLSDRLVPTGRAFDPGMMQVEALEFEPTEAERERAQTLIAEREQEGLWGWKEPRTALFIDFWKAYLPKLKGIVIYRHPWAVHNSMRRREHWDLLMFPDQVFKSYVMYNEGLLRAIEADPEGYLVVNAEASFGQLERLDGLIGAFIGAPIDREKLPVFYPDEFKSEVLTASEHALIGKVAPEAIATFERLEICSKLPYTFAPGKADEKVERLLVLIDEVLSEEGKDRSAWIPLVEEFMLSSPGEAVALRVKMAEAMGEKVRNMYAWHKQAEKIFEEAEWVEAERKRLSEFLEKQTAEYEKIWGELTKVGKGWEKQRDYIKVQKEEIDRLNAIIAKTVGEGNK